MAHLEWLVTVAYVLLGVLWVALAAVLGSLALIAVSLRVDRLELGDGRLARRLVVSRPMQVSVEGAELKRVGGNLVVCGADGTARVVIPRLFYTAEDLERLWAATGISEDAAGVNPPE